jgi:hypothetical protein
MPDKQLSRTPIGKIKPKLTVRAGKCSCETTFTKKEIENLKASRQMQIERINAKISSLQAEKSSIEVKMAEDDEIIEAIDGGGDFG